GLFPGSRRCTAGKNSSTPGRAARRSRPVRAGAPDRRHDAPDAEPRADHRIAAGRRAVADRVAGEAGARLHAERRDRDRPGWRAAQPRPAPRRGRGRGRAPDAGHPRRRRENAARQLRRVGAGQPRALDRAARAAREGDGALPEGNPPRRRPPSGNDRDRGDLGQLHGDPHAAVRGRRPAGGGRAGAVQGAMTLRARSWLFLAALAVAAAILAGMLSRGVPLQTNVLAMLPATERDPVAEKVVASLSAAIGSRVLILFSHADEARAKAGAERFAAAASGAGGLRSLMVRLPEPDPKLLHKLYAASRFGLLSEPDRETLASGRFRARDSALQQIVSPVGSLFGLPLAQDPFGFFGRWMASIVPSAGAMRLEDGYLVSREAGRTRVLVLGEVDGDVYDNAVQARAVAAYERGAQAALAAEPGTEIQRTGTVFFAASARAAAMRDMDRIALGSIAGITLVMFAVFRSLRPIALGLLSAGAGILAATLVLILVDGELHLVTLAFGASLIGEAIDYAILFCAAHLAAGNRWTPQMGV